MSHLRQNLTILVLLGVVNGTPIFLKRLLGDRLAMPLDFGLRVSDGPQLLGSSKTFRGLTVSIAATAFLAVMLNIGWLLGAEVTTMSRIGDIAASFLKRRLGDAWASRLMPAPSALTKSRKLSFPS